MKMRLLPKYNHQKKVGGLYTAIKPDKPFDALIKLYDIYVGYGKK
jgi:hypothetical protein